MCNRALRGARSRASSYYVRTFIYDKRRGETSLLEKCVSNNTTSHNSFLPIICMRLASVIFASKDNGRSYYLQPKSDVITLLDISE